MSIGIIGTGAIAEAVVIGLCTKPNPTERILLSPRNAERAHALAERFSNVAIANSNQDVVSNSDLIFLGIRPQVVEDVLRGLTFQSTQRVLSFIAGVSIQQIETLVAPAKEVVRMIPLPANARHEGPILMSPPSEPIAELFQGLGSLIQVDREDQLEAFSAVTGLMAPYFGLLDQCSSWLSKKGIEDSQAHEFVGALFDCLGKTSQVEHEHNFGKIAKEHATPQGFNEQALRELTRSGWYEEIAKVLDLLNDRLEGRAGFEDCVK